MARFGISIRDLRHEIRRDRDRHAVDSKLGMPNIRQPEHHLGKPHSLLVHLESFDGLAAKLVIRLPPIR